MLTLSFHFFIYVFSIRLAFLFVSFCLLSFISCLFFFHFFLFISFFLFLASFFFFPSSSLYAIVIVKRTRWNLGWWAICLSFFYLAEIQLCLWTRWCLLLTHLIHSRSYSSRRPCTRTCARSANWLASGPKISLRQPSPICLLSPRIFCPPVVFSTPYCAFWEATVHLLRTILRAPPSDRHVWNQIIVFFVDHDTPHGHRSRCLSQALPYTRLPQHTCIVTTFTTVCFQLRESCFRHRRVMLCAAHLEDEEED